MLTEEQARSLKPYIMKCSWPRLEKVKLEGDLLKACHGEFGTPKQVASFCAPFDEHQDVTNELFMKDAKPVVFKKPKVSPAETSSPVGQSGKKSGARRSNENPFDDSSKPKESAARKSSSRGQSGKDSGAPRSNDNPFVSDALPQGHSPFDSGAGASLSDPNVSGNPIPDQGMSIEVEDNKITDTKKKDAIPKVVKPPSAPDYRALVISILEDEGVSFVYCKDAVDLCDCLVHSMLGTI